MPRKKYDTEYVDADWCEVVTEAGCASEINHLANLLDEATDMLAMFHDSTEEKGNPTMRLSGLVLKRTGNVLTSLKERGGCK